ncbi:MAG: hypothetical protein O3C40_26585 [Planctomycetota bacterium]|nr:hypothetical protein [Planctomycetota bacterium]
MARVSDPALRLRWQRRLRKFQTFQGSVRRFCDAEGVSVASFYQWRQKLNDNPVATTSDAQTVAEDNEAAQFVPLQLVPPVGRRSPAAHIAIVLAGGTRIELPSQDSPVLQAVIRSVMHEDAKLGGERREFAGDQAGGRP